MLVQTHDLPVFLMTEIDLLVDEGPYLVMSHCCNDYQTVPWNLTCVSEAADTVSDSGLLEFQNGTNHEAPQLTVSPPPPGN